MSRKILKQWLFLALKHMLATPRLVFLHEATDLGTKIGFTVSAVMLAVDSDGFEPVTGCSTMVHQRHLSIPKGPSERSSEFPSVWIRWNPLA